MSIDRFLNESGCSWINADGPQSDIVLTSRIRLARNLKDYLYPILFTEKDAQAVLAQVEQAISSISADSPLNRMEMIRMSSLEPLQKQVLVEKHLISPNLAEEAPYGACLISDNEEVSIMINEEDHIRIQCITSGLQLEKALNIAFQIDDELEKYLDYAFHEVRGYLTSCPTNVGTGLRASVMMHLPGLVMTRQINQVLPSLNQLGIAVRGIYGEGSEAIGNIFQISNQITLGKSEEDIIRDLTTIVEQVIEQERAAREQVKKSAGVQLEDRIFRSLGVLMHSRIIESKEAAQCISDVRLGIDLGYIPDISPATLNELLILTQPGILQQQAGKTLPPFERDVRRATLIRERIRMGEHS